MSDTDNRVTLRPSHLKELLRRTIPAKAPVLITGAPGVGKSDIVEQVVKELKADFILSHPAVEDPTVPAGLPWPDASKNTATFLPFGQLARALKAKKLTVWMLDDFGQATPAVQAAYMQLLLARRINNHVLPDSVVLLCASNRRTDRAGVQGILEPVKSRFVTIIELHPNLDDWCEWAQKANIAPEVIGFLRFRSDMLHSFQPTADLTNSPCPRTWAFVSKLLHMKLPREIEFQSMGGAVGGSAATEFMAFVRAYRDLPDPDGILDDPKKALIPQEPSILYAVVAALAYRASSKTFAAIFTYAERLTTARHGEFAVLLVRDSYSRSTGIVESPAWNKFISSKLGRIFSGEEE